MKIKLPLSTTTGWHVHDAEIVDIAPHLAGVATFAIHRQTPLIRHFPLRRGYAISNVETGASINADGESRAECLSKAVKLCKKRTVDDVLKAYRQVKDEERKSGKRSR